MPAETTLGQGAENAAKSEVRKPVASLSRVAKLYDGLHEGRFNITPQGVTIAHPLLPLPDLHNIHSATPQEHLQRVQNLNPNLRALLQFLPTNAKSGETGVGQELEEKVVGLGNWLLSLSQEPTQILESIVQSGHVFVEATKKHHGDFIHGLAEIPATMEDEVAFHYVHFLTGDPIQHTYQLREKGFAHHPESIQYQTQVLREALRHVIHPTKIKEAPFIYKIISAIPRWDALVDIIPTIRSAIRSVTSTRIHDEIFTYALTFGLDATEIPSPGIDIPSIKPHVETEILAKAIMGTELMEDSLIANDRLTPIAQDLHQGHVQIAQELLKQYPRQIKKLETTVRDLTFIATTGSKPRDKKAKMPELTNESIMTNTNLTPEQKTRLIMGKQLLNSLNIIKNDPDLNPSRKRPIRARRAS